MAHRPVRVDVALHVSVVLGVRIEDDPGRAPLLRLAHLQTPKDLAVARQDDPVLDRQIHLLELLEIRGSPVVDIDDLPRRRARGSIAVKGGKDAQRGRVLVDLEEVLHQAQLFLDRLDQAERDFLRVVQEDLVTHDLGFEPELLQPVADVLGDLALPFSASDVGLLGQASEPPPRLLGRRCCHQDLLGRQLRGDRRLEEAGRGRRLRDPRSRKQQEDNQDHTMTHTEPPIRKALTGYSFPPRLPVT